ncbi:unnamed protein product [Fusarium graminearum]|uniref:Chromosome 1, complete genome n=1 Tax=Gibberella zeae (strain ATCC MYA-4620 / CBS 123657 / FGSC 9075 / NRRL 31084 / PH-1) TaxID=229533 RepID=I1SA52_GIBZE|nr:hypothetical protein FGSG_13733 [Fusarium graminearum PH-1]ESU16976.1 hypothetical protein FGSG_13733 [Fusarium graminearum PH-1]CEF75664.1 unnamed protein product [Fusarium graminearum]CZS78945.1 unnamed protein product [Fusarium graminearum]|eukprot:XP_011319238.1 hypothetical protein FGSG_13733 [Fusarium graminearum PH-1]
MQNFMSHEFKNEKCSILRFGHVVRRFVHPDFNSKNFGLKPRLWPQYLYAEIRNYHMTDRYDMHPPAVIGPSCRLLRSRSPVSHGDPEKNRHAPKVNHTLHH